MCTNCLSLNINCTHNLEKKVGSTICLMSLSETRDASSLKFGHTRTLSDSHRNLPPDQCCSQKRGRKRGYDPDISQSGKLSERGDKHARALVDSILSYSKPFIIPDDREAIWDILVSLANHARSLDRQLSSVEGQTPQIGNSSSSAVSSSFVPPLIMGNTNKAKKDEEVQDSIDQLAEELKKVNFTHERRHFAKSSFFLLVHSAVDPRQETFGDRAFMMSILEGCKRSEFWQPPSLPVSLVTVTSDATHQNKLCVAATDPQSRRGSLCLSGGRPP